jgi:phosphoglycerate dehydrogenase-like enzyme
MTKPNVLIASYLEPELIDYIRHEVPDVTVAYFPDLLGKPRYIADHTSVPERSVEDEKRWRDALQQADILFDFDHSHRDDLPELAPNVKWIQATSAGIGQFVNRMGYAEQTNWIFTTASGVHARPLAEFCIMAMLMFAKDYPYLRREQDNHRWQRDCAKELSGSTLGMMGLGNIGQEVARIAKSFDMRVIGNRRNPSIPVDHVDQLFGIDDLSSLLKESQYLALSVPHTLETENLIGKEELAMLPSGAIIINIARGVIMDHDALIDALKTGRIAGAALDVSHPEPLPQDSPLWDMPNVLISPHSASTATTENTKLALLFCDNLKLFLAGGQMINVLDTELLY